jgi:hypothetical protein
VFSEWSAQSGYKGVFGSIEQYITEVKSRVSGRQPTGFEFGSREIELSESSELVRNELDGEKKTSCVI